MGDRPFLDGKVRPGDVFFDKLPDGRYERCILQLTTDDTPDRHKAARGGTGQFYERIEIPSADEIEDDRNELIMDVDHGFTMLRPCGEG